MSADTVRNSLPNEIVRIEVDRSTPLVYPHGLKPIHKGLDRTGPTSYDLFQDVVLWRYTEGTRGFAFGEHIWDHLLETRSMSNCLGLADGYAIKQKGGEIVKRFCGTKHVFLWKSIAIKGFFGTPRVPALFDDGGIPAIRWQPLSEGHSKIKWQLDVEVGGRFKL